MKTNVSAVAVLAASATLMTAVCASAANGPPLHPNSEIYRQKDPPAATGRSGNANLSVRMLMNRNGTTDVDVTTGTLDSAVAAPGRLSKVQLKAYDGAGGVQGVENYNGLNAGGSFAINLPDLERGQPIETQANIDGIDKRTDVVTVTGNVKLRPDLVVDSIDSKDKAVVGAYVHIAGVIAEHNGDIGANGDCLLSVDGTVVDSAVGIYVDSGSEVTCLFTHRFSAAGTHTIRVSIANVVPGDYDMANNAAEKSIVVVPNTVPLHYSASVSSSRWRSSVQTDSYFQRSFGGLTTVDELSFVWVQDVRHASAWLDGWSPSGVTFPLEVALSQASDGTIVDSHAFGNLQADDIWGDSNLGGATVQRFDPATFTTFYLKTSNWRDLATSIDYGNTTMEYRREAGDVTYFGAQHIMSWIVGPGAPPPPSPWTWNFAPVPTGIWPIGAQYSISVNVTDANWQTMQTSANITTQATTSTYNPPTSCTTMPGGSFNPPERRCTTMHNSTAVTSGVASSP